ncbi:hypothetical protein B1A_04949 [mine drainage metagenome]|uniref:HicB family protein n=1 Tax=mine drainage metagenome TaxID=410659 RepID=T1CWA4_9ZZZZ
MNAQLKMVFWQGDRYWLGKLVDHPEIMCQGENIEELEVNLRDAYRELLLEDVPLVIRCETSPFEARGAAASTCSGGLRSRASRWAS